MKKEILNTTNAPNPVGPYSQAVKATGSFIFLSGQIARDLEGKIIGDTVEEQTHKVIQNLETILVAQGLSLENVVKTTVLMMDLGKFTEMNAIYDTYFGTSKPARATYQVSRLPMDVLIEIEAIAVC